MFLSTTTSNYRERLRGKCIADSVQSPVKRESTNVIAKPYIYYTHHDDGGFYPNAKLENVYRIAQVFVSFSSVTFVHVKVKSLTYGLTYICHLHVKHTTAESLDLSCTQTSLTIILYSSATRPSFVRFTPCFGSADGLRVDSL